MKMINSKYIEIDAIFSSKGNRIRAKQVLRTFETLKFGKMEDLERAMSWHKFYKVVVDYTIEDEGDYYIIEIILNDKKSLYVDVYKDGSNMRLY